MKQLITAFCLSSAAAALAAPGITGVTLEALGNPGAGVKISYTLTGEPAIVTVDVEANEGGTWRSVGYEGLDMFSGEANKVVRTVDTPVYAYWFPTRGVARQFEVGNLRAVLKAWPTNNPPDYLTIDLAGPVTNVVNYYTSTNALPGGFTNRVYRTDKLLMRKIPAAGVVWLMGSPANEAYRSSDDLGGRTEALHKVMLTEDYYAGVFEVTQAQYKNVAGSLHNCTFTDYYDADVLPFQGLRLDYLRGQVKGDFTTYWPANGHNVTAGSVLGKLRAKCGIADIDLPTEAQWEYASRAGTEKNLPDWGAHDNNFIASEYRLWRIDTVAWWANNSSGTYVMKDGTSKTMAFPHPVGTRAPNTWGIYDTIGNVMEACLDHGWDSAANADQQVQYLYDSYATGWEPDANGSFANSSVTVDPTGVTVVNETIGRASYRGGCWRGIVTANERYLRNAARTTQGMDYTFGANLEFKGFRLVCSVKEATK